MNQGLDIRFAEVSKVNYYDDVKNNLFSITAKLIDTDSTRKTEGTITAKPLYNNIKFIPIEGEIVLVLKGISETFASRSRTKEYYYLYPLNIHGNLNHNSLPLAGKFNDDDLKYDDAVSGNSSTQADNTQKIGEQFPEKSISNLQPYQGDVMVEGRWGNSIRLTSTIQNKNYSIDPFWKKSSTAKDGSPIIILRTTKEESNGFTVEDINKDDSSIYMTSGQIISSDTVSDNFKSYTKPPDKFNAYKDNQVILSSDRLVFFAKKDSIFLNSKKTISISANDSINMDAGKEAIIDSPKIYLGSNKATEPVVLGQTLFTLLNDMITAIQALQYHPAVIPGTQLLLEKVRSQLRTMLSPQNKTL